ncbi:DUF397 domain-containing protein [Actinoallomurus sp. CA-142502]
MPDTTTDLDLDWRKSARSMANNQCIEVKVMIQQP